MVRGKLPTAHRTGQRGTPHPATQDAVIPEKQALPLGAAYKFAHKGRSSALGLVSALSATGNTRIRRVLAKNGAPTARSALGLRSQANSRSIYKLNLSYKSILPK